MRLSKTDNDRSPASLDRSLVLELVRVTERAAIASAGWRGKGDEKAADAAAVEAMRTELGNVHINGRIVIGEGERDEAPMLFIGEEVGAGDGPDVDIAVDPLEGTTLCAKNQPDSICVLAMAERGGLLNAPDVYMQKLAIGAGYAAGVVDIDASARHNISSLADAKGVPISEITVCMLDRPRHANLLEELRSTGCAIKLISDGDIAGIIHAVNTEDTGIDIYLGSGGAPEGVLAAAALRCIGGQMQARLILDTDEKRDRAPIALVLNYPSNPTAYTATLDFYKEVVAYCKAHNIFILSDLAYSEIYFDGEVPPSVLEVPGAIDITVEFTSMSKTYSMPGWRVGFAVGNERLIAALARVKSYLDYGAFTPIQVAAAAALNGDDSVIADVREIYQMRRDVMVESFARSGWNLPSPKATMFVWSPIPDQFAHLGSLEFAKLLIQETGVAVAPGVGFGEYGDQYVRLALVENEQRIRQAARNIKKFLAGAPSHGNVVPLQATK